MHPINYLFYGFSSVRFNCRRRRLPNGIGPNHISNCVMVNLKQIRYWAAHILRQYIVFYQAEIQSIIDCVVRYKLNNEMSSLAIVVSLDTSMNARVTLR